MEIRFKSGCVKSKSQVRMCQVQVSSPEVSSPSPSSSPLVASPTPSQSPQVSSPSPSKRDSSWTRVQVLDSSTTSLIKTSKPPPWLPSPDFFRLAAAAAEKIGLAIRRRICASAAADVWYGLGLLVFIYCLYSLWTLLWRSDASNRVLHEIEHYQTLPVPL